MGIWGFSSDVSNQQQTLAIALLNAPWCGGLLPHRLLLSPSLRRAVSPGRAPPEPELDPSPGTGSVPDGIAPQSHSDPTLGPRGLVGKRGKWGAKSEGRRRTVPSHAAVSKSALDLLNVL